MGIFIVGISYTRNPDHKPGDTDADLYTSTHISYDDAWLWAGSVRANPEPGVKLLDFMVATPSTEKPGVWLATTAPEWFTAGKNEPPTPADENASTDSVEAQASPAETP